MTRVSVSTAVYSALFTARRIDRGDRWRRVRLVLWEEGPLHLEKDRWRFRMVGRLADQALILLDVTVPLVHLKRMTNCSGHFWEIRAYHLTPSLICLISREQGWEVIKRKLCIAGSLLGERGNGPISLEKEDRILEDCHRAPSLLPLIMRWIARIQQGEDSLSELHMGASYD